MRNSKFQIAYSKLLLLLIVVLALFLRFYELGNNPPSLDWDEVSIGYNAYSLLKTGKDEFGTRWPISIRSFEDYKPAIYTYLAIPTIALWDLNEFAVRMPSVIAGVITILGIFLMVEQLADSHSSYKKSRTRWALVAALLVSISPWHLQFSRVAFEANVALCWVVWGVWAFLIGLKSGRWWILSAVFFVLSFYSYHSPRLVVPLMLAGFAGIYRRQIWSQKSWAIACVILGCVLLVPLAGEFRRTTARFSSVAVADEKLISSTIPRIEFDTDRNDLVGVLLHNRRIAILQAVIAGYLDHFNPDFLFLTGDTNLRHRVVNMGMLYFWELPFLLMGMLLLIKKRQLMLIIWLLAAPVAAALTGETPHAVRSLLALPAYQMMTALGLTLLRHLKLGFFKSLKTVLVVGTVSLVGISMYSYLESYYLHTPIESAKEWQYGYKQAVYTAAEYENQVDKIVFTYAYDQPHAYVLFYRQIDPVWYQSLWTGSEVQRQYRSIGKYEFRSIQWEKDQHLENTLFIGTAAELPDNLPGFIKNIYFPDGTIAFRIVKQ